MVYLLNSQVVYPFTKLELSLYVRSKAPQALNLCKWEKAKPKSQTSQAQNVWQAVKIKPPDCCILKENNIRPYWKWPTGTPLNKLLYLSTAQGLMVELCALLHVSKNTLSSLKSCLTSFPIPLSSRNLHTCKNINVITKYLCRPMYFTV